MIQNMTGGGTSKSKTLKLTSNMVSNNQIVIDMGMNQDHFKVAISEGAYVSGLIDYLIIGWNGSSSLRGNVILFGSGLSGGASFGFVSWVGHILTLNYSSQFDHFLNKNLYIEGE